MFYRKCASTGPTGPTGPSIPIVENTASTLRYILSSDTAGSTAYYNTGITVQGVGATGTTLTVSQVNIGLGGGGITSNTAIGYAALTINTTGYENTAIGTYALGGNKTGGNNTALGYTSLNDNTTGGNNTGIGGYTLRDNTTGINNTAVGTFALNNNTTGNSNTAIGLNALSAGVTGSHNIVIGPWAGSTGTNNVIVLDVSGIVATDASNGFFVNPVRNDTVYSTNSVYYNTGTKELTYKLSGPTGPYENTAGVTGYILTQGTIGVTAYYNTGITVQGVSTNTSLTVSDVKIGRGGGGTTFSTAIGFEALNNNTSGAANTAIGYSTLSSNTSGDENTAIGCQALTANTTGNNNTANGYAALNNNTTGDANTAIGSQALNKNTTGNNNTAVGCTALIANTTGGNNTAIGLQSLTANTIGNNNTAIGSGSLDENTTGYNNTAIGSSSLTNNSTGYNNTAIGYQSLHDNTLGNNNTAIGFNALYNTTSGNNTAIGYSALSAGVTGEYNIVIGPWTGAVDTSNVIVLDVSGIVGATASNGFFVNPVRLATDYSNNVVSYNTTSKELTYFAKTFVINHPLDPANKYLVHGCLEGPEAGVYYRGTAAIPANKKSVKISLPAYVVESFATDYTVHLTLVNNNISVDSDDTDSENTSLGPFSMLYSSKVQNGKFRVYSTLTPCEFSYIVFANRFPINVEPLKNETDVKGSGPYTWIE